MGNVVKFRKPKSRRDEPKGRGANLGLLVGALLFLAVAISVSLIGLPTKTSFELFNTGNRSTSPQTARTFSLCQNGGGRDCVVDGDTFWLEGVKYRVADIDAPETHPSRCAREAELGDRATERLRELLNQGAFALEDSDRDTDIYGRKLRTLTRNGQSLGQILVTEGLARTWTGHRQPWC
jgi:endonuclease YncB( thermonuclease family)